MLLKVWLGGPSGNTILLVGPCDAGKTTMFFQLRDGTAHLGTVASMQPNIDEFALASEQVPRQGRSGVAAHGGGSPREAAACTGW